MLRMPTATRELPSFMFLGSQEGSRESALRRAVEEEVNEKRKRSEVKRPAILSNSRGRIDLIEDEAADSVFRSQT
jgi:hypothetical protein